MKLERTLVSCEHDNSMFTSTLKIFLTFHYRKVWVINFGFLNSDLNLVAINIYYISNIYGLIEILWFWVPLVGGESWFCNSWYKLSFPCKYIPNYINILSSQREKVYTWRTNRLQRFQIGDEMVALCDLFF